MNDFLKPHETLPPDITAGREPVKEVLENKWLGESIVEGIFEGSFLYEETPQDWLAIWPLGSVKGIKFNGQSRPILGRCDTSALKPHQRVRVTLGTYQHKKPFTSDITNPNSFFTIVGVKSIEAIDAGTSSQDQATVLPFAPRGKIKV